MPKMVNLASLWKLEIYSVTKQGNFDWTKIGGNCKNKHSNETISVIFKQCIIVEMLNLGGLEWKLKFWRVKELLLKPHHKQQVYIWSLKTQVKQSSWGFNCSNDDDFCNARHDSCAVNHCNFMPDGRWRLPSSQSSHLN